MKKYAVVVAGGTGKRMGAAVPKQFLLLHGKPLLWYTLDSFLKSYNDIQIILVVPEQSIAEANSLVKYLNAETRITVTKGGTTRFQSVQNGLGLVLESSIVFVHDGVRCLITKELIQRCYQQAVEKGSAIPAIAATDSIRIVAGNSHAVADRNNVRIIQTPQTFRSEILLKAFSTEHNDAFTDEATVVEASGESVFLIEGEHENIKITRPADLLIAERILAEKSTLQ